MSFFSKITSIFSRRKKESLDEPAIDPGPTSEEEIRKLSAELHTLQEKYENLRQFCQETLKAVTGLEIASKSMLLTQTQIVLELQAIYTYAQAQTEDASDFDFSSSDDDDGDPGGTGGMIN